MPENHEHANVPLNYWNINLKSQVNIWGLKKQNDRIADLTGACVVLLVLLEVIPAEGSRIKLYTRAMYSMY